MGAGQAECAVGVGGVRKVVAGMSLQFPELRRVRSGVMESKTGEDGAFDLRMPTGSRAFAIASVGEGWEHVSVSMATRVPTWEEMCWVKRLFWQEEDCVVQYHPPKSDYVNCHPFCLHLWRPLDQQMPRPPSWMVVPTKAAA